jgi:hypothetical protein
MGGDSQRCVKPSLAKTLLRFQPLSAPAKGLAILEDAHRRFRYPKFSALCRSVIWTGLAGQGENALIFALIEAALMRFMCSIG